jgi:hypothetical protein
VSAAATRGGAAGGAADADARAGAGRWTVWDRRGAIALGVALACTSATRLRLGGAPLGPGEALLLLWLAGTVLAALRQRVLWVGAPARVLVATWVPILLALLAGYGMAVGADRARLVDLRDLLAFGLGAMLTGSLVLRPAPFRRLRVALAALAVSLVLGSAVLLMAGVASGAVRRIVFYGGVRFAGLAENPNQLALVFVPIPFVLARLRGAATGRRRLAYTFSCSCRSPWASSRRATPSCSPGWRSGAV